MKKSRALQKIARPQKLARPQKIYNGIFGAQQKYIRWNKINQRVRCFTYDEYKTKYEQLLASRNERTLYQRRFIAICSEIYKTIRKYLNPAYIHDIFAQRPSNYPTRKPNDVFISKANRKTLGLNSMRIEGSKLWNLLPENIKMSSSLAIFKQRIKKHSLPNCKCTRNSLT